ncbi:MAG: glycosyltransferase, partial [Planctomycetota bacterium]
MQKKRVLYIIEELSRGGAERVVVELARHIDRRRFEPYVCCLREKGAMAGDLKAANVPVLEMHKRRSIDLRMLGRLCRAIRRLKIDIVHTHLFTANAWGRLAARLAGVPRVVASEHSVDESRDGLRLLVDRALAACTDTVIAKADAVADFCRRRIGVNGGKLRVVPNGVDVSQYSRASRDAVRREM